MTLTMMPFPSHQHLIRNRMQIYIPFMNQNSKNLGYLDLTGRFPYRSQKGNQYILIAYHEDANLIYGQALNNRESASIVRAWTEINNKFDKAGASPNTYVIDNEASSELKTTMDEKGIKHQWSLRTIIVRILPKEQFKHLKITL